MILAMDVTTRRGAVAWLRDDGSVHEVELPEGRHAERLAPCVQDAVTEWGAMPEKVGVTVGPGSFTGIRIGLALAQGLSAACACALYGFSVFDLMRLAMTQAPPYRLVLPAGGDWSYQCVVSEDGRQETPSTIRIDALTTDLPIGYAGDIKGIHGDCIPISLKHAITAMAKAAVAPTKVLNALYVRPPDARTSPSPLQKMLGLS